MSAGRGVLNILGGCSTPMTKAQGASFGAGRCTVRYFIGAASEVNILGRFQAISSCNTFFLQ